MNKFVSQVIFIAFLGYLGEWLLGAARRCASAGPGTWGNSIVYAIGGISASALKHETQRILRKDQIFAQKKPDVGSLPVCNLILLKRQIPSFFFVGDVGKKFFTDGRLSELS